MTTAAVCWAMQIFVAGWIERAKRYGIPSELIIVEWNRRRTGPADRCAAVARRFGAVRGPLHRSATRIARLGIRGAADRLDARHQFQIGRRARGEFVLATNIDILFSDELAEYLAARRLERGRMYRIDRHDAMSDVPVDAPVEEQLAFCATHLIRINLREGSFNVTPVGEPVLSAGDVATPDSGIVFGRGWFPLENHMPPVLFRWAGDLAEVHLNRPTAPGLALIFDLEPAPSAGDCRCSWRSKRGDGKAVTDAIECRQRVQVRFDSAYPTLVRLRARRPSAAQRRSTPCGTGCSMLRGTTPSRGRRSVLCPNLRFAGSEVSVNPRRTDNRWPHTGTA
jgi:hypothetical protein